MKATGVVRRMDDLGRIVIPKEVRRTLRIKDGDPLEIFTDRDGEIIFKKYSPIGDLATYAKEYADSLYESTSHTACICDEHSVIAVAGGSKQLVNQSLGPIAEQAMERQETVVQNIGRGFKENEAPLVGPRDIMNQYTSAVISPILAGGRAAGCVILLGKNAQMTEIEQKLAETAANFLGKQLE
ncbi:stage V sporulation T C-terminal domain-containing protein [Desulforudis sp. 1088]|uniref:stage V sporulation T C-terminal domain-containing protein n=1 Tax=unclassified Candidatus Desulforudis TaxID=2635950 RepID=UPI003488F56A